MCCHCTTMSWYSFIDQGYIITANVLKFLNSLQLDSIKKIYIILSFDNDCCSNLCNMTRPMVPPSSNGTKQRKDRVEYYNSVQSFTTKIGQFFFKFPTLFFLCFQFLLQLFVLCLQGQQSLSQWKGLVLCFIISPDALVMLQYL